MSRGTGGGCCLGGVCVLVKKIATVIETLNVGQYMLLLISNGKYEYVLGELNCAIIYFHYLKNMYSKFNFCLMQVWLKTS